MNLKHIQAINIGFLPDINLWHFVEHRFVHIDVVKENCRPGVYWKINLKAGVTHAQHSSTLYVLLEIV